MQNEDLADILALSADLQSAAFSWPAQKLTEQLPLCEVFVAEDKTSGELLGYIGAMDLGAVVEILMLATAQKWQGKKIMSGLFRAIIATHYQGRTLWLEVHEANVAARNLYRSLGFAESGHRPRYYSDGAAAILCTFEPREF